MTVAVASSTTRMIGASTEKTAAQPTPPYRTKTSFVAVHFHEAGKGRIVFLPHGAILHVVGPSSCLQGGFEVILENRLYNIFEIDLFTRSSPICEPIPAQRRAVAASS